MRSRREFLTAAGSALLLAAARIPAYAAPAARKTILLRSAWDTINIGDIGHTPGTLRVFEQYLPEYDVVLWASKLNEPVQALLERRFPNVPIVQGGFTAQGGPQSAALREAWDRADLVVHNSSMSASTTLMTYCHKTGKPYGMFGQSYFPRDFDEQANLREVLSAARFAYARDGETLKLMRAQGVSSPVVEFNPDGCFGIDVRDEPAAERFLRTNGLEPGRYITLMQRTNTSKHPGVGSLLNPLDPTPQQQADDERRARGYRQLIATWVKQTGLKVLIAPEVEKEIIHNKRLLYDPLPDDIRRHVVRRSEFWNADEAASVFARAICTVCHEPHSCIIALANGTPILHTASQFHSPKMWMFRDIGLADWLFDIDADPPERYIDTLLAIHADPAAARSKAAAAMQFVHERFHASSNVIRNVLES